MVFNNFSLFMSMPNFNFNSNKFHRHENTHVKFFFIFMLVDMEKNDIVIKWK